ncbi:DUF2971 domain-containing protein [Lutibacter sp.]|uniref:DUF2971 domain-containing protein n=1 Tax=Lutibacter sp. TaxID=1925666 RepID=UPI001A1E4F10|nr:DUF2971 domain-containing protein [Lutibacter sp.]MBI9042078.1 DUF2971 domain-containing protein [Lutibacter sp.]
MAEYKYKDRIYKLTNDNYDVVYPDDIKLPKNVFKYYGKTNYSIDAIINNYLFCSHPYHLNDSIDSSSLLWDFTNLSKKVFDAFYKHYYDSVNVIDYDEEKSNSFVFTKQRFFEIASKNAGIISLTTNSLQTLMWAHYSTENGFMIELDWEEIKDNLKSLNPKLNNYAFFPIQYVDKLESIDFFDKNFDSRDIPYLYSSAVKRKDWIYENEWRLMTFTPDYGVPNSIRGPLPDIQSEHERKLYYPKKAVKSIVLGKHFLNSSNLKKIIDDKTYQLKTNSDLDFINFLMENYNDRIYFCGEYQTGIEFKRSAEKVHFEKVDWNTIQMIREDKVYI